MDTTFRTELKVAIIIFCSENKYCMCNMRRVSRSGEPTGQHCRKTRLATASEQCDSEQSYMLFQNTARKSEYCTYSCHVSQNMTSNQH